MSISAVYNRINSYFFLQILENSSFSSAFLVAELMNHMDFSGWNSTDFLQIYNELLVNFVPNYEPQAPPRVESHNLLDNHLFINPAMDEEIFSQLLATSGPKLKQADGPNNGPEEMTKAKVIMQKFLLSMNI